MSIEKPGANFNQPEKDLKTEQRDLLLKKAEEVLGDQYNGMEITDIVSYFNEEKIEKWSNELSSLSERIEVNQNLSSEEIIIMKSKFIGQMSNG